MKRKGTTYLRFKRQLKPQSKANITEIATSRAWKCFAEEKSFVIDIGKDGYLLSHKTSKILRMCAAANVFFA